MYVPITLADSMTICAAPGGVSAFLTTPLDVAKTRIMLAEVSKQVHYATQSDLILHVPV